LTREQPFSASHALIKRLLEALKGNYLVAGLIVNKGLTFSFLPCNAGTMKQIKPTNKMVNKRRLFLWAVGRLSVVRRSG
jgi:hypothetical protein